MVYSTHKAFFWQNNKVKYIILLSLVFFRADYIHVAAILYGLFSIIIEACYAVKGQEESFFLFWRNFTGWLSWIGESFIFTVMLRIFTKGEIFRVWYQSIQYFRKTISSIVNHQTPENFKLFNLYLCFSWYRCIFGM